jgi:hypothetical protein
MHLKSFISPILNFVTQDHGFLMQHVTGSLKPLHFCYNKATVLMSEVKIPRRPPLCVLHVARGTLIVREF